MVYYNNCTVDNITSRRDHQRASRT